MAESTNGQSTVVRTSRGLSIFEAHYCEVKAPPSDFLVLASTVACRVQAMRHRTRPLYGVQFHPEEYTKDLPAGMRLLENFFHCAEKLHNSTRSTPVS